MISKLCCLLIDTAISHIQMTLFCKALLLINSQMFFCEDVPVGSALKRGRVAYNSIGGDMLPHPPHKYSMLCSYSMK